MRRFWIVAPALSLLVSTAAHAEGGPPAAPPPDARFAEGVVSFPSAGLSLAAGFGVPLTRGTAPPADGTGPVIVEAADSPAAAPPDARFAEGALAFPSTGLSPPPAGTSTFDAGAAGFAVREEAGGGLRFTLSDQVLFDFDRADLRPEADATLDRLMALVRERLPGGARFTVEGHTDAKGSDAYNFGLSYRRADAVVAWLRASGGVPAPDIVGVGYGESRPVAPNTRPDGGDDPKGRQKNRRVEIVVHPLG